MQVAMKSVKYIIIAALFLVASSQASYMYESRWPGHWVKNWVEKTLEGQPLNQVPVCIDVPGFVQVLDVNADFPDIVEKSGMGNNIRIPGANP